MVLSKLEKQFKFTAEDRAAMVKPAKERVLHCRINAKALDLENGGDPKPTEFFDDLWNSEISSIIAEKHGVSLVHGGKGGNYDSQVGSVWGREKNVLGAAAELSEYFSLVERLYRTGHVTNMDNITEIYKAMMDDRGNIRHDVATATVDQFLKAKEKGFEGDIRHFIEAAEPRRNLLERKPPSLRDALESPRSTGVVLRTQLQSVKSAESSAAR